MLLPALLIVVLGQAAFPDPIFTSSFPVSRSASVKEGTVEIEARVTGKVFAELTARRAARYVAPGRFVATLGPYPRAHDRATKAHLACTFLVDCDEAPVKAALNAVVRDLGDKVEMPALTSWVGHYITKKTYVRDFDAASIVAERREGDCTEHAVLLAALARARHIPARVVTGLVLLESSGKALAEGHAWVEWHDGKHWIPADAALSAEQIEKLVGKNKVQLSYLPVRVLDREDVGFSALLVSETDTTDISGLVLAASAGVVDRSGSSAAPRAP